VVVGIACLRVTQAGAARLCGDLTDDQRVFAVLARIERSVDPCGESAVVRSVIERFRRCAAAGCQICLDPHTERNFTEHASGMPTTITWNPDLRGTLESGCGGDPRRPVRRDPVASLLHELAHAVQYCEGLAAGELEFEALRVENVYRRASGQCQRTRYGDEPLPPTLVLACEPGNCHCGPPSVLASDPGVTTLASAPVHEGGEAGDAGASPTPASGAGVSVAP
jgi:hypothetical protein